MNIVFLVSYLLARIQDLKWNDYAVNQLIAITHNINQTLDSGNDVCAVFLDV